MADNIIIRRMWQDTDFFQIAIECYTDIITVRGEVYTSDALINDLYNTINEFLSGNATTACWKNGERGDATTPCISLGFYRYDELGHVKIEVYLELEDGGCLATHNCCFYISTEIGLLYQFKEELHKLKKPQLGISISLNALCNNGRATRDDVYL